MEKEFSKINPYWEASLKKLEEARKNLEESREILRNIQKKLEEIRFDIPTFIREKLEEELKEEELISEDYPLGGMVEPYDIWKEQNL